jgi:hypothetical protein
MIEVSAARDLLGLVDRGGDVDFPLRSLSMNFLKLVAHMACPTPILPMIDPAAAARRL